MAGESQVQAIGEIITWLEQQVRAQRDEYAQALKELDVLRRQVHDHAEQLDHAEQAIRAVEPRFLPFKGLPEKIRSIDESTEHIRQQLAANRAEVDNALRLLRAEAQYDREERADVFKRIEAAAAQVALNTADIAQVQAQVSQANQVVQSLIERQREVEQAVKQFGLRLDRTVEVHRDLEDRVKSSVFEGLDDRFEVVFERLQVVGEMVKRNEDLIQGVVNERSMREELLHEMAMWRDLHGRIDQRVNVLEEQIDDILGKLEKVANEVTLLEGRHAGLGERVFAIRKDIAEVVDHVRAEFAKYNQLMEKQRRKQIQVLEQELREMKFHAFRPPEEP